MTFDNPAVQVLTLAAFALTVRFIKPRDHLVRLMLALAGFGFALAALLKAWSAFA